MKKVDEYTYSMQLENIEYIKKPDTEEIKDGVRYIYSTAYGLDGADEVLIYLPGTPYSRLPEEFIGWARGVQIIEETDTKTNYYGLYNVAEQLGFVSEIVEGDLDLERVPAIEKELAEVEMNAKALEMQLSSGKLPQQQMNQTSYQLYMLWDEELNAIWKKLKETLDEDTMSNLLKEQRQWIKDKEQAIKDAGAECEGGSLQPLMENDKGAELTKKRVYELAEFLR